MERKTGQPNGYFLREVYKDCSLQIWRTMVGDLIWFLNRPGGVLKSPGTTNFYSSVLSSKWPAPWFCLWIWSNLNNLAYRTFYPPDALLILLTCEFCRLGELHTLRGHVESVVRLKNLDLNVIQSAHTVWCNDINSLLLSCLVKANLAEAVHMIHVECILQKKTTFVIWELLEMASVIYAAFSILWFQRTGTHLRGLQLISNNLCQFLVWLQFLDRGENYVLSSGHSYFYWQRFYVIARRLQENKATWHIFFCIFFIKNLYVSHIVWS